MEMCYDGALIMPSKFVSMNEEEMTYVDGGVGFYLNSNRSATIATYVYLAGFGISAGTAIAALSGKLAAGVAKLVGLFAKVAGMISGPVGGILAGIVGIVTATNLISFFVGAVTADRKNTGVNMNWYGAYFGNFRYN